MLVIPIRICPHCQSRIVVGKHDIDYVHSCNSGKDFFDKEDIRLIGSWIDYTGSGTVSNPMLQGASNELFGTRAWTEGANCDNRTKRGNNATTTRTRKHLEYIPYSE